MVAYYNALVMVALALSMLGGASYFWKLARAQRLTRSVGQSSNGWTAVPGKITQSEVVKDEASGWYLPAVAYDYAVAGQDYHGAQIAFAITYPSWRKKAQTVVGRYKPGSAVQVYCDPADPSRCVLERGARTGWFGPWLSIPFAILAVAIAGGLVLAAIGSILDRHAGVGH